MKKGIYKYNSCTALFVFFGIALVSAINAEAFISVMSFVSAASVMLLYEGFKKSIKKLGACFVFIVSFAAVNPLISHNGKTVLTKIFGMKYTLEAVIYGVFFAVMMSAVMLWMNNISIILTPDSMIQVFGRFFSKTALVLSISLGALPMYVHNAKQISDSTRSLGLYNERFGGFLKVKRISGALIYSMPEAIIDKSINMNCRGFGNGKYRCFVRRRVKAKDVAVMLIYCAFFVFAFVYKPAPTHYYPLFGIEYINIPALALSGIMYFLPLLA
ncbi:MAG: energy-coupling factor transporter transmembrane protein EcfT [Clostridiales bacterium]|nr:energy-coupling factor transporter transmembrane protein EcfT [Clostridiales bacterium]